MGAAHSIVSPEAALAAALVAGALAVAYTHLSPKPASAAPKGTKKPTPPPARARAHAAADPPLPGQFEPAGDADPAAGHKKPKKKKKKGRAAAAADTRSESSAGAAHRPVQPSSLSADTDGSWTRVAPRRRGGQQAAGGAALETGASAGPASDAGAATPVTGTSSPATERTEDEALAGRLLPGPRRTGVDDMLETPDYASAARVLRVQPRAGEHPARGFSWADYEDVRADEATRAGSDADGEDDGWGVVKSKGRSRIERNPSSQAHASRAPETLTKKQRQNASRREAQRAARAEGEAQRQVLLAKHTRELERAKMAEQHVGKGVSGKMASGGMSASVDERGKLVWQ